ncbi:MAG: hypothetical protein Q4C72_08065 [Eubacteriales bacterium]|nr:hypothetical protein [Eubacteriales bacterium]
MKKLIIACLVVLLAGGALAIGGAAAGGELYGSYYDGALHSVRESFLDGSDFVRRRLHYEEGYGRDGVWHSGWFEDGYGVDDFGGGHFGDGFDDGLADLPDSDITKLDLSFDGGNYRIIEGDTFGCTGAIVRKESMHNGKWELSLKRKNSTEATVTLPQTVFEELECNVGGASVVIDLPLTVQEAEFNVGAGSLTAAEALDAKKIELDCGMGSASLLLAGGADEYGYEIAAALGSATLNDDELAGGIAGTRRAERRGGRSLEINVGAGSVELFTED